MTAASRSRRGSCALAVCVAVVAGAGACGASASANTAAVPIGIVVRTCTPPHYPGIGYFDSITVTGTNCATGRRFVLAYYKCRTRSGLAGRCGHRVLGFRCTETRRSIPTEIDARDTCTRSHETIVSVWQQDIG